MIAIARVDLLELHTLMYMGNKRHTNMNSKTRGTMTDSKSSHVDIGIPGLALINDFITPEEEKMLLDFSNKQVTDGDPILGRGWSKAPGNREVLQYGYEYKYVNKNSKPEKTTAMPSEFKDVVKKVTACGFKSQPDQCIVNKYQPGQGISAHVDHTIHFGPVIASLSLGSGCIMEMSRASKDVVTGQTSKTTKELWLAPRSLLVLSGESRYDWSHYIPARKNDIVFGSKVARGVRTSLTFRTMNL